MKEVDTGQIMTRVLAGQTYTGIGKDLSISRKTVSSIVNEPEFQEELKTRRNEIIEQTVRYLQKKSTQAARVIVEVMNDPLTQPQTRLNAANAILSNSIIITDMQKEFESLQVTVEELKQYMADNDQ